MALSKKKGDLKKACLDGLKDNQVSLEKLTDYLNKLEKEISRIDKESTDFKDAFGYKDLERNTELEAGIKKDLDD